uniref:Uncharacterized protein n=1 Tax=Helianthus annuus TaxID=4232 RepID=A0A251RMY5_HELAN
MPHTVDSPPSRLWWIERTTKRDLPRCVTTASHNFGSPETCLVHVGLELHSFI